MKLFLIIAVNSERNERWIMDQFTTKKEAEQEMKRMNARMEEDPEEESTLLHIFEIEQTDTEV